MYTGDTDYFEKDNCMGLPRPLAGNRNVGATFGADIGMDFRPSAGGARCQGSATAGTAANYPSGMVTYETGTTYRLAWAPKNHVAAECTNAFIPDAFLKLYMTPYNQAAGDPDQATFRQNQVPASFSDDPHVNGQIDFKGFQNCPKFCENTDKSLCTGTFSIPDGMAPGVYTFQWYWAFNGEADLYSTCWEATVAANTGGNPTGGVDGSGDTPTGNPEPTTSSEPTTIPPDCVGSDDCCLAGETIAPGTGTSIPYDVLRNSESRFLDCPENYDGQFKLMCINAQARHVDGFCSMSAALLAGDDTDSQSGTVAGLSVALAFTIIAFVAYIAITRGWVEAYFNDDSEQGKAPKPMMNYVETEPAYQKRRANSVLTTSNTELPVLPETPKKSQSSVEWYYVNEQNESIGPVPEKNVLFYCRGLPNQAARDILVWNEFMTEWKPIRSVPALNYP